MTKQMWFFISLGIVTILCAGFLLLPLQNSGYYPIIPDKTMRVPTSQKNMTIPLDTGKPCGTSEEWHKKADQTGEWIDGVLIEPAIPDTEIISILNSYNISSSQNFSTSPYWLLYCFA
jgi:hypothetical protein